MKKSILLWTKKYFSDPEAICIVLLILGSILVIETMGSILTPIVIGVIFAYLLAVAVKQLEHYHCPHMLAVSLVYSIFLGMLALLLLWLLPLMWQELNNLLQQFPSMLSHGQTLIVNLHNRYPEIISVTHLQQLLSGLSEYLANIGKGVLTFSLASIVNIFTLSVYLVLVPLLVFFFLRDSKEISQWLQRFLPATHSALSKIGAEVQAKTGCYLKGKIFECIIVAIVTIIVFVLLDLNYAVLLGTLVGVSVIIPYVGFVLVTIPIVIVAFLQWGFTEHAFYLFLVYFIIALLDANVLVPCLFAEAMNLHPVAIILGVVVFGSLGGFWGVFFAIPLLTVINSLITFWPRTRD